MSDQPGIGQDQWVARSGENIRRSRLQEAADRVPGWARLLLFVVVVAAIPLVTDSGYINRVVWDTLLFCMLALGLNVVVGWGGLLDLGYIAFYGVGAYTYAILSSDQFDVHLTTPAVIVITILVGAALGLLVGLPSWRLSGDYLAIVTLFAYQIFLSVVTNGHDLFAGQPLADRSRLASRPRGHARRRADGDADRLAEAARLRLRCSRGRAHGRALRVAQPRRLPGDVLAHIADHDLHDGDPRWRRKPDRGGARSGARLRVPRGAA
jgi:hypothetical protein